MRVLGIYLSFDFLENNNRVQGNKIKYLWLKLDEQHQHYLNLLFEGVPSITPFVLPPKS